MNDYLIPNLIPNPINSELLSSAVAGALLFGVNDYLKRLARGDNMTAPAIKHHDNDNDDHELVTGDIHPIVIHPTAIHPVTAIHHTADTHHCQPKTNDQPVLTCLFHNPSTTISSSLNIAIFLGPLLFAAAGTGLLDGITSKPLEMLKLRQQILPTTPPDLPPLSVVQAIYAKPQGLGLGNADGPSLILTDHHFLFSSTRSIRPIDLLVCG